MPGDRVLGPPHPNPLPPPTTFLPGVELPRAGGEGADTTPFSNQALVFAGNSFVGRHLCRWLREAGWEHQATSREGSRSLLPCDLTDTARLESILEESKPEWIFQCAGATAGGDRAAMDRLHVEATVRLLDAVARIVPAAKVVLFGSAAEYGRVEAESLPVKEDYPCRPLSAFGQSKLAQLEVARAAGGGMGCAS